ncbi:MAG: family 43 glycosylhydrolase [Rikenellaceae bacterium]
MKRLFIFILAMLFGSSIVISQNPIIGDIGISDPHFRVFNDTIYLFSGHDGSPEDRTWVMRDWRVYSTTNLVDWEHINTISPKDNYMGEESTDCWAGDGAMRNGQYYFYFSDRKRSVGVMSSDDMRGQFRDAIGEPLVAPMHDPTILIDDDPNNTPYLIYGDKGGGGYHIARLNEDMISVAEEPKLMVINGEEWENEATWMDKNYIFKHNGVYYLSWGAEYATSSDLYGPYNYAGRCGKGYLLGNLAHSSFFNWKGQFYHAWCYYLRNGYKWRSVNISYCHMADNGDVVTDTHFLDQHYSYGVARYEASWDRIEAEWFYEVSEGVSKRGMAESGFHLIFDGSGYLRFQEVDFAERCDALTLMVESDASYKVSVRKGSYGGEEVGSMRVKPTGDGYEQVRVPLNIGVGVEDIYILFETKKRGVVKLDWVSFK